MELEMELEITREELIEICEASIKFQCYISII